jgi:hypothetical protein
MIAATFFVAFLIGGCGGESDGGGDVAPQPRTDTGRDDDPTNGPTGNESNGPKNPCEETLCVLFRKGGGGTFVCSRRLEFVRIPADTQEATGESEPTETNGTGPAETVSQTVLRPVCPGSANEIPVEGIDLEERADVSFSEDGEAAWTTQAVRIRGRIQDGTLVVDE